MDEELEDVTCWIVYRWSCPHCTEVNEDEVEPSGETQCDECGAVVNITGSM